MHLNYIVLAHKSPGQLARMIQRLDCPEARFYINIDAPVEIAPFQAALAHNPRCSFFTGSQRLNTMWGHVNAVKAALVGIAQILADQRTGYTILMSGQDYPLKNNTYIQQFYESNYGTNFIECFPLPVTKQTAPSIHGGLARESWIHPEYGFNGGMNRLNHYTFFLSTKREDNVSIPPIFSRDFLTMRHMRYALGLLRRQPAMFRKLLSKRKFPNDLIPHGGSQWWALPHETVVFLNTYVKGNPYFLTFNDFTLLSDEIFFQTVVANNFTKIASPVTYVNFTRPIGPWPATFVASDITELVMSPCLYARKFDQDQDSKIMDELDAIS
ncbi:beta-1,6-N-acetylglucosaminyltransferase [Hymenobacter cheonanensis]|uniref:beta-1,6-N-acetylglucosaminyltransferase n=1 Tax=Hymenobacter sp. CA2-7 TaxID=3063993 RepID=UPI0027122AE7|nr:beta-1,6-N-acetylglucosaminyltransferase [Hymenobacter sp. CA2-7]MDO7884400.1 beta-1,6-N-acetylglucosaminyltransferase [Hymenobacter sp. CA2-7]